MKTSSLIMVLLLLWVLTSCEKAAPESESNATLETNTNESMSTELKWSVILETNTHPLSGKTLNFDVEMVEISKSWSGTLDDTVESGDTVKVHYTGTLENGEKFDSSLDRGDPLGFTVGAGEMIPGFDAGVVGMKLSDKKTLVLPPEEAYGWSRPETVPMKDLESFVNAGIKLEVGEKLPTQFGELEIIEVISE